MENPFKKGALMLATNGIAVFPVKARGKTPLIKSWPDESSTEPTKINGWWDRYPNANIGVVCGKKSDLFIIDLDGEEGVQNFQALQKEFEPLETSIIVKTARGYHLWFRYPEGEAIRNSASQLGQKIDIRSDRGYAVAPPSIHETGVTYRWVEAIDYGCQ